MNTFWSYNYINTPSQLGRYSLDTNFHHWSSSLDHFIICIFKSYFSSSHLHLRIWIITRSGSSLVIITRSGSSLLDHHHWIRIITGSGSSLLDHHHWIWIITAGSSSLDLDHHWCYLMILLVTRSSIELSLFHAGCRPSLHVGILLRLYLTLSQNGLPNTYIWPY